MGPQSHLLRSRAARLRFWSRALAAWLLANGSAFAAMAQEAGEEATSPWLTFLASYGPILLLIALWFLFFRGLGFGGMKGSFKLHLADSVQRMERIEKHLERIATSLESLASQRASEPKR